jgi:hypothetical protein
MKATKLILAGTILFAVTTWAAPKDQNWSGWISDSKCAAKGAAASHEACAKKCIDAGAKPVLVSDKDQKVMAIDNPDAVKSEIGQHVKVSGSLTQAGAVHVSQIQTQ